MTNTKGTLQRARSLAIAQRKGMNLTQREREMIAYWVDRVSPENFYMDGELFA